MKVGDRVKVSALDPKTYAVGAAEALSGMSGTVERIDNSAGQNAILVKFDRPAPTWWSHQTPPTGAWFEPGELMTETSEP